MSNFLPGTRGQWWTLFFFFFLFTLTCSVALWEGGMLQTNNTGVCSQCPSGTGFAPAHSVCAFPVYTAQALGCSARNCLRQALSCMHLPGLSHSGSGTQVLHKGADSIGPAFCALPRSEQLGCLTSAVAATYRLSCPCFSVFCVYDWCPFSGRW